MGEIEAGAFISITLAWDRIVNLDSAGDDYTDGDTFFPNFGFPISNTNFDLHLLPKDSTSIDDALWSSIASDSSVEHIFHEIETTGEYEFWVYQNGSVAIPDDATDPFGYRQRFGVAWWFDDELTLLGDFDNDGDVDGADLVQWQGDYGVNPESDADGDGDTDGADFLAWQRNFTGPGALASAESIPEPSTFVIFANVFRLIDSQKNEMSHFPLG